MEEEKKHRMIKLPVYDDFKDVFIDDDGERTLDWTLVNTAGYWTTIVNYNGLEEDCYKLWVDLIRIKYHMLDLKFTKPFDFDRNCEEARFNRFISKVRNYYSPDFDDNFIELAQEARDRFLGYGVGEPGEKVGEWGNQWAYTQKHCIWMFLGKLAGEWGTSIRCCWLEPTQLDNAIDFMTVICNTRSYCNQYFDKEIDVDTTDYAGWRGDE